MVWWEAQAFVNGLRRRQRSSWEQTRWLARLILSGIGGKKKDGSALTDEDIQIFPWEDKQPTQEELDQEEEDRKYLEAQCIEYNRAASK